jgi:pyruvate dehydrogenase E2 component (dihydrolipoamide acetyltransferase)
MAKLILMPEISANVTSAVIKAWSKKEGDAVAVNDCLAEIETEKALIEFGADEAGVLGKILAPIGQDIAVGVPIAVLYAVGESAATTDITALLAAAGVAAANVGAVPAPAASSIVPAIVPTEMAPTGRLFISPLARRLALEKGVDLSGLQGSGPHGRIVKRDVERAASVVTPVVTPVVTSLVTPVVAPVIQPAVNDGTAAFHDVPHSSMRKTIARRLTESKASIPHFYLRADCRMDKLLALRKEINLGQDGGNGRKMSVNDFLVKAVAVALRALPEMNVSWTDAALRHYARVDIAVAVSTDNGLITPVVRGADSKSLSAVSATIADLAGRARSGKLAPDDYQGGSFTISNLGMFGVSEFSAIINPPQAAILAVGSTEQRAIVVDGALAVASMMSVTLSVDHRAIDGALAARWLAVLQRTIENPLSILI